MPAARSGREAGAGIFMSRLSAIVHRLAGAGVLMDLLKRDRRQPLFDALEPLEQVGDPCIAPGQLALLLRYRCARAG